MYNRLENVRKHVTKVRTDDFEQAMLTQAVEISGEQRAALARKLMMIGLNEFMRAPEQYKCAQIVSQTVH